MGWTNTGLGFNRYDKSVIKPRRIHCSEEDYHKSYSLTEWLFMKYNMSYKSYRNKSKSRRVELKKGIFRRYWKVYFVLNFCSRAILEARLFFIMEMLY